MEEPIVGQDLQQERIQTGYILESETLKNELGVCEEVENDITHNESFILLPILDRDIDQLIRDCDFPAMLDNPLRRLMFPSANPETFDEEIQWNIDGLRQSLARPEARFRKVCNAHGLIVGFAIWTLDSFDREQPKQQAAKPKNMNPGSTNKSKNLPSKETKRIPPRTLDITASLAATKLFAEEKKRALSCFKKIWRLNLISVRPTHQYRGIGTMLMQWGCDQADQHGLDSYVMGSPAGIKLYRKFGFETVGDVKLNGVKFESMLRLKRSQI